MDKISSTPNNEKSLENQHLDNQSFENLNINEKNSGSSSTQIITEDIILSQLPNTVKETYSKIKDLWKQNKFEEALDLCYSILQEAPNCALIYKQIGFIYHVSKRFNEAIEYYTKAIELEPNYYSGYSERAQVYLSLRKLKEAEEDFKKSLSINRNNVHVLILLGHIYERLARYEEAIAIYKEMLEKAPSFRPNLCLSRVYLTQGNFTEAWKVTNEALKFEPRNSKVHSTLAKILIHQEQNEKALEFAKKANELNPNNHEAISILRDLSKKLGIDVPVSNQFNQFNSNFPLQNSMNNPTVHQYPTHPNQPNMQHPVMLGKPIAVNGVPMQQYNSFNDLRARIAVQEKTIEHEKLRNKAIEEKLLNIGQEIESIKQSNPNLNYLCKHLTLILQGQAPIVQGNQISYPLTQSQQTYYMPQMQQQQFPQYPQQGITIGNSSIQMQMNHQGGSDMMMDDEQ